MPEPYRIVPYPDCPRLQQLEVDPDLIEHFLKEFSSVDERELRLRPYRRFLLAGKLDDLAGNGLSRILRGILEDGSQGGILADFSRSVENPLECLKLATALTHLIGRPKKDPAGGTYFAWLTIEGSSNPESYQLGADSALVLHTDGVYEEGETDWIFFMKSREQNAQGGLSRILHLEDWPKLDRFRQHPMAFEPFVFQSELFDLPEVKKSFFYKVGGDVCIRMNDQEARPQNRAQAQFIQDLLTALQNSDACRTLELPVGAALLLNNSIWLHGRDPFEPHDQLLREVIRQRGEFADTMG